MRGILIDIDGVIYQGGRPIPGAVETMRWLASQRIPHLLVTNTTSRPCAAIVARLAAMGVEVGAGEILTPLIATRDWLRDHACARVAPFVSAATAGDLELADALPADAEQGADAVVIGDLGEDWDFATLNRAFRLLMNNPDAPLIALGMTRYWRADDGLRLDVAPFVVALEHASGRRPLVLGKPSVDFFDQAAARCGLPLGELAMIGDDIRADVAGAQEVGMTGILVRTGKFAESDLDGDVRADVVLGSFADLPGWWRANAQ